MFGEMGIVATNVQKDFYQTKIHYTCRIPSLLSFMTKPTNIHSTTITGLTKQKSATAMQI